MLASSAALHQPGAVVPFPARRARKPKRDPNALARLLKALDVRIEERVATLLPDSPEFAFAFFGSMKIGAVALPLNTLLKPRDYEYLLNDSRARALVVHSSLLSSIADIRDRLIHLRHTIVAGEETPGLPHLEKLMQSSSPSGWWGCL